MKECVLKNYTIFCAEKCRTFYFSGNFYIKICAGTFFLNTLVSLVDVNAQARKQNFIQSGAKVKIKKKQETEQFIVNIFMYKIYCKKLIKFLHHTLTFFFKYI